MLRSEYDEESLLLDLVISYFSTKSLKIDILYYITTKTVKGTDRNRQVGRRTRTWTKHETKDKHRTHSTTPNTKAGVTRTLQQDIMLKIGQHTP